MGTLSRALVLDALDQLEWLNQGLYPGPPLLVLLKLRVSAGRPAAGRAGLARSLDVCQVHNEVLVLEVSPKGVDETRV